jgi:hypothetical protein
MRVLTPILLTVALLADNMRLSCAFSAPIPLASSLSAAGRASVRQAANTRAAFPNTAFPGSFASAFRTMEPADRAKGSLGAGRMGVIRRMSGGGDAPPAGEKTEEEKAALKVSVKRATRLRSHILRCEPPCIVQRAPSPRSASPRRGLGAPHPEPARASQAEREARKAAKEAETKAKKEKKAAEAAAKVCRAPRRAACDGPRRAAPRGDTPRPRPTGGCRRGRGGGHARAGPVPLRLRRAGAQVRPKPSA